MRNAHTVTMKIRTFSNVGESYTGAGVLVPQEGDEQPICYRIDVMHNFVQIDSDPPILGSRTINGAVWDQGNIFWPMQNVGKAFVLRMSDGRKLRLIVRNKTGSIASRGSGGIYKENS